VKLISLNCGLPREVHWRGQSVTTSIYKEPVHVRVALRTLNLDGDRQSDLAAAFHPPEWRRSLAATDQAWGAVPAPAADTQAAMNTPASCLPSSTPAQNPGPPPAGSCPPQEPPAAPAHRSPRCTYLRCPMAQSSPHGPRTSFVTPDQLNCPWNQNVVVGYFYPATPLRGATWSIFHPARTLVHSERVIIGGLVAFMCRCEVVGSFRKSAQIETDGQVGVEAVDFGNSLPFHL
jgi:hypothetical protein